MNYSEIKYFDVANGPGARTSLFVSGCRRHCRGCFNPDTWNFEAGKKYTKKVEEEIIESLLPSYIHGLTVLGGEPMEPENQKKVSQIVARVDEEYPDKTIWIFSGWTFEELTDKDNPVHTKYTDEILSHVDVLVDGPFIETQKNVALRFRGSENQRILDIPASLEAGEAVPWEDVPIFAEHEASQLEVQKLMRVHPVVEEPSGDAE